MARANESRNDDIRRLWRKRLKLVAEARQYTLEAIGVQYGMSRQAVWQLVKEVGKASD